MMPEHKSNHPFPILKSKINPPPVRPHTIHRGSILKILNGQIDRNLTLITAPAGFGKTTLIRDWVKSNGVPFAWYSIDVAENDLVYFIHYLVASLQKLHAGIGATCLDLLTTPQPLPGHLAIISLLNDLYTIDRHFILILDDYHFIESEPIHETLAYILDHIPDNMHLVISSRSDPPLKLSRVRAQGNLIELRASDLKFTSSEIHKYFTDTKSLQLSRYQLDQLELKSEGWITGLQLIKLTLKHRADIESLVESLVTTNRYIADYLVEEVLARQPESWKQFLLETSILEQLSGPLCMAVTGNEESETILIALEKSDLFLFLMDDEGMQFRYHSLFAELLSNILRVQYPELIKPLHQRAAVWLYANQRYIEAISHFIEAEEMDEASSIMDEQAAIYWEKGAHTRILNWISLLPSEQLHSRPNLSLYYAWVLMANGQIGEAEYVITHLMEQLKLHRGNSILDLSGKIEVILALMAAFQGKRESIVNLSKQALENLSNENILWRGLASLALGDGYSLSGNVSAATKAYTDAVVFSREIKNLYFALISHIKLAVGQRQAGLLEISISICQDVLEKLNLSNLNSSVYAGVSSAILGESQYERNELEASLINVRKGIELTSGGIDMTMLAWSYHCYLRVTVCSGNYQEAKEAIDRFELNSSQKDSIVPPWVSIIIEAWKMRLHLSLGEPKKIESWLLDQRVDLHNRDLKGKDLHYLIYARFLIYENKIQDAGNLLDVLIQESEGTGRTTRLLELYLLKSIVLYKLNNLSAAIGLIERTVAIAEPYGFINIFLDEGPDIANLLNQTVNQIPRTREKDKRNYIRRILFEYKKRYGTDNSLINIDTLSQRELEVLSGISAGLSNQEIADTLFISLNTVRTHTKNINHKLAVHSRTQAISVAKELGLI